MNKKLIILTGFIFLTLAFPVFGLEISVEATGSEKLTELKDTIKTTINTRITAKGLPENTGSALTVQLAQLGSVMSFDALLKSVPPRAYHKDLKSLDEISAAIDDMLLNLLGAPQAGPPAKAIPQPLAPLTEKKTMELQGEIRTLAALGTDIYLADERTIYRLQNDKTVLWWQLSSKLDEICRITAYKDTLIVLINHAGGFITCQIKDGQKIREWAGVVVPLKETLVKASIKLIPDIRYAVNRWSQAQVIEGDDIQLPINTDILATATGDVYPKTAGNEIITLSASGKLNMLNGKTAIWTSDNTFNTLPLSIEEKYYVSHMDEVEERVQHYYLPPRILVQDKQIVIAGNNQGLLGILDSLKRYKNTQVLAYTWTGTDMEQSELASTSMGYCLDVAIQSDKLLSLIVMKKGRMLMVTGLK